MTKRVRRKYKLLRFYQEDLWGKLSTSLKFKKVKINKLLDTVLKEKIFFKSEIQKEKQRLKEKYGIQKKYSKKKRFSYRAYRESLRAFIRNLKSTYLRPIFNFRTDVGKPKRKTRIISRFGRRLKNRQKLRKFSSNTMTVRQFRNYLKKARKHVTMVLFFFRILESRLDTLIYRLNLIETPAEGRQLINHGNFLINGKISIFPSSNFSLFDVFSVLNKKYFYQKILNSFQRKIIFKNIPIYIEINFRIMSAVIYMNPIPSKISYPSRTEASFILSSGAKFN
jgi:small subunit ribosomal protein S4